MIINCINFSILLMINFFSQNTLLVPKQHSNSSLFRLYGVVYPPGSLKDAKQIGIWILVVEVCSNVDRSRRLDQDNFRLKGILGPLNVGLLIRQRCSHQN